MRSRPPVRSVVLRAFAPARRPGGALRAAALLAALLLAGAASAEARGLEAFAAPDAAGPYAVGHTSFEVTDAERGRTLPVDVWYPVDPEEASGFPATEYSVLGFGAPSERAVTGAPVSDARRFGLVLFSHGSGGIRFQSYFLTEALASHGFVVAAPDHVGNTILDGLNDTSAPLVETAVARLEDASFVITRMLERSREAGDRFHASIARRRIGATGHSFGGFTALGLAAGYGGETGFPLPEGAEPVPPDPRVRAIVPIAPASFPYSEAELEGIRVPTTVVGGTLDTTTPVEPESARIFEAVRTNVVRADVEGAVHFSFSNACALVQSIVDAGLSREAVEDLLGDDFTEPCDAEVLAVEEAHRLTNLYTVATFRRYLDRDPRYGFYLSEPYATYYEPDVTADVKHRTPPFLYLLILLLFGR